MSTPSAPRVDLNAVWTNISNTIHDDNSCGRIFTASSYPNMTCLMDPFLRRIDASSIPTAPCPPVTSPITIHASQSAGVDRTGWGHTDRPAGYLCSAHRTSVPHSALPGA
ncbi:hypothetical protein J1614_000882 [Plenodomus biglobosus]|nr:hypothetical protein J1614_000882 [Plenodomus biglobosus]